jgi:hypothetical protein
MRDLSRLCPPIVWIIDAIGLERFAGMEKHALQVLGTGFRRTNVNDISWHRRLFRDRLRQWRTRMTLTFETINSLALRGERLIIAEFPQMRTN